MGADVFGLLQGPCHTLFYVSSVSSCQDIIPPPPPLSYPAEVDLSGESCLARPWVG